MKILAVGDSHTKYLSVHAQVAACYPPVRGIVCNPKVIAGASMAGVGKLESTLMVGDRIQEAVAKENPDFLVINLGQVDIELGIPFKEFVQEKPLNTREYIDDLVNKYFAFLDSLEISKKRVVVKGINLPALCYDRSKSIYYINRIVTDRFTDDLADQTSRTRVIESLKKSYPSDRERVELAHRFNRGLREAAFHTGFGYFDINESIKDPATGFMSARYLPASNDHHLVDSMEVRIIHWEHLLPVLHEREWSL